MWIYGFACWKDKMPLKDGDKIYEIYVEINEQLFKLINGFGLIHYNKINMIPFVINEIIYQYVGTSLIDIKKLKIIRLGCIILNINNPLNIVKKNIYNSLNGTKYFNVIQSSKRIRLRGYNKYKLGKIYCDNLTLKENEKLIDKKLSKYEFISICCQKTAINEYFDDNKILLNVCQYFPDLDVDNCSYFTEFCLDKEMNLSKFCNLLIESFNLPYHPTRIPNNPQIGIENVNYFKIGKKMDDINWIYSQKLQKITSPFAMPKLNRWKNGDFIVFYC